MGETVDKVNNAEIEELKTLLYQAGNEALSRSDVDYGLHLVSKIRTAAPNTRQRAERAVAKIVNSLNLESNFYVSDLGCKEFTDIIAAEFDNK